MARDRRKPPTAKQSATFKANRIRRKVWRAKLAKVDDRIAELKGQLDFPEGMTPKEIEKAGDDLLELARRKEQLEQKIADAPVQRAPKPRKRSLF